MTQPQPAKGERLDYLDGLRGVASLVVILHHAMLALHPDYANYHTHYLDADHTVPFAPVAMLWQGNVAVCVFFVLSGYVLAPMTLRGGSAVPSLVARRIVRLGIPIFVALLFGYALWMLDLYANIPAVQIGNSQGWWEYLYNERYNGQPQLRTVLRDGLKMPFISSKSKYDPVVWTMHLEYIGSFAIFILYRLFPRRRIRVAVMTLVLCATMNHYYMDFAAGALLFDLDVAGRSPRLGRLPRRLLTGGLLAMFVLFGFNTWSDGPGTPYYALDWLPAVISGQHAEEAHQISAIFLLAAILVSPGLKRLFSTRTARYLGRVSFATYLLHMPLLCSAGALVLIAAAPTLGFLPAALLLVATVLATTFALAGPFARHVDFPATRLSQRVGKRVDIWWNQNYTNLVGRLWHLVPHGRASSESRWSRSP